MTRCVVTGLGVDETIAVRICYDGHRKRVGCALSGSVGGVGLGLWMSPTMGGVNRP
jgi:hypothetical protein